MAERQSSALPGAPSNIEHLPLATHTLLAAELSVSSPQSPETHIYLNYIGEHIEGHRDRGTESKIIQLWGKPLCNLFYWPWIPFLWGKHTYTHTQQNTGTYFFNKEVILWSSSSPACLSWYYCLTAKSQGVVLKFLCFLFNCCLGCDFSKRGMVPVLDVHVVSLTLLPGSKPI